MSDADPSDAGPKDPREPAVQPAALRTTKSSPAETALALCAGAGAMLGFAAGGIGGFVAFFKTSGRFPLLAIPVASVGGLIGGTIIGGAVGAVVALVVAAVTSKQESQVPE